MNFQIHQQHFPHISHTGTAMHHHPSSKYRQHRRPSAQELLLEDLRQHQRILDEGLKSTSLIMRTMRSASEFDEAMRRLSIASIESALVQPTIVVPTPMLRSHSYQEEGSTPPRAVPPPYPPPPLRAAIYSEAHCMIPCPELRWLHLA